MQESLRWQDGQKAKEILMGDEFSMTTLLIYVAFDKILFSTYYDDR